MGTSECIVVVVLTMISTTHEQVIRIFITYNISTTIRCTMSVLILQTVQQNVRHNVKSIISHVPWVQTHNNQEKGRLLLVLLVV